MTNSRALGLPVCSIRLQILPAGSQKRANAQRFSASLKTTLGPTNSSACLAYGVRVAVSRPSNPIFSWVPSQNGLFFECPHLHSAYSDPAGNFLPSTQSQENPL